MSPGGIAFDSTADTHLNVSGFALQNHNMYNNYINGTTTPNVHAGKVGAASPVPGGAGRGIMTPGADDRGYATAE